MDVTELSSAEDFRAAICAAARAAVDLRARRLVLVDRDFDEWPLDDPDLLDALTDFVRLPGRQVLLLGRSFEAVARSRPRFVRWRQIWGHAVDARRPVDDELPVPTLLLADRSLAVEVLDKEHWRGRVLQGDPRIAVLTHDIDAFAQRTEATFGATTLGL